jgi:hypothetical protein
MKRNLLFLLVTIAILGLTACSGKEEEPTATAVSPTETAQPTNGTAAVDSVQVMMMESFPIQVSVLVRGELPDACTSVDTPVTTRNGNAFAVSLSTTRADCTSTDINVPFEESVPLDVADLPAGTYSVDVNGMKGSFTFTADNVAIAPTPTLMPTVAPTPTAVPEPTAVPTETAVITPTTSITNTATLTDCTNIIGYIDDITIPDDTVFAPNDTIVKTWRLRNDGTCPWTEEYTMVYVGGDDLIGPITQTMPIVAPNSTVDLTIEFTAPATEGTYRENWQIADANGTPFGIGGFESEAFWLQVQVSETAEPQATAEPGTAVIGGLVWRDYCTATAGRCIQLSDGFRVADGIYSTNERVLPNLTVSLSRGVCPSNNEFGATLAAAVTDANGIYRMEGLDKGNYCAWVDIYSAENVNLLIPGNWTWPAPGIGYWTVVLVDGEQALDIDFGWDDADD